MCVIWYLRHTNYRKAVEMSDDTIPPSSGVIVRRSPTNNKPSIGKYTADGIAAVLSAVNRKKIEGDVIARKGLVYLENFVAYLRSDAYRQKSVKQARVSAEWRALHGQSRSKRPHGDAP